MIPVLLACAIGFQTAPLTTPIVPPKHVEQPKAKPKPVHRRRHVVVEKPPVQKPAPPKPQPYVDKPAGYGTPVQVGDIVTVHFLVRKQTGESVANSKTRGLPYTFKLGEPGNDPLLDMVVKGMKVGAVRTGTIAAKDAYGPAGAPPSISPKDTLLVTITLLRRGDK